MVKSRLIRLRSNSERRGLPPDPTRICVPVFENWPKNGNALAARVYASCYVEKAGR